MELKSRQDTNEFILQFLVCDGRSDCRAIRALCCRYNWIVSESLQFNSIQLYVLACVVCAFEFIISRCGCKCDTLHTMCSGAERVFFRTHHQPGECTLFQRSQFLQFVFGFFIFYLQRLRHAIDLLLSIFPRAFQLAWRIRMRGEVVTDAYCIMHTYRHKHVPAHMHSKKMDIFFHNFFSSIQVLLLAVQSINRRQTISSFVFKLHHHQFLFSSWCFERTFNYNRNTVAVSPFQLLSAHWLNIIARWAINSWTDENENDFSGLIWNLFQANDLNESPLWCSPCQWLLVEFQSNRSLGTIFTPFPKMSEKSFSFSAVQFSEAEVEKGTIPCSDTGTNTRIPRAIEKWPKWFRTSWELGRRGFHYC